MPGETCDRSQPEWFGIRPRTLPTRGRPVLESGRPLYAGGDRRNPWTPRISRRSRTGIQRLPVARLTGYSARCLGRGGGGCGSARLAPARIVAFGVHNTRLNRVLEACPCRSRHPVPPRAERSFHRVSPSELSTVTLHEHVRRQPGPLEIFPPTLTPSDRCTWNRFGSYRSPNYLTSGRSSRRRLRPEKNRSTSSSVPVPRTRAASGLPRRHYRATVHRQRFAGPSALSLGFAARGWRSSPSTPWSRIWPQDRPWWREPGRQ